MGYSEDELSRLVVPKRTLARRRANDELLTVEETDKALRLKRIATIARKSIRRSRQSAGAGCASPSAALVAKRRLPISPVKPARAIVEEMLGRIEHGIYA